MYFTILTQSTTEPSSQSMNQDLDQDMDMDQGMDRINDGPELKDIIIIREGFSLGAFFFTLFWLIYKKQYFLSVLSFVILICLVGIMEQILPGLAIVVILLFPLFMGFEGNQMIKTYSKWSGFRVAATYFAASEQLAMTRFFETLYSHGDAIRVSGEQN